jgi:hypothetical protein
MNRLSPVIFLFLVQFCLVNCKSSKLFSPNVLLSYKGEIVAAWNDDTANGYHFLLTSRGFNYTITKIDSLKQIEQYFSGKYSISRDTVFLRYKDGKQPTDVVNYLIIEGSGNYLIQPFKNDKRRIFLRFRRRPVF